MSQIYRHSDGSWRDYSEKESLGLFKSAEEMANLFKNESDNYTSITVETPNGTKHDQGKPRTELIPTEFILEVAKALTFGADKYGDNNFRNGIAYTRLLGAAKRHIELELAAIEKDSESNHSHLAHAGASLAMYAFMKTHRPDQDDRYKYTDAEKEKLEEMMYGLKR